MDEADLAQEQEEMARVEALYQVKRFHSLMDGVCNFCEAPLPDSKHFCDSDCREDFERENKAAIRNGTGLHRLTKLISRAKAEHQYNMEELRAEEYEKGARGELKELDAQARWRTL
jgi:predicted amidophosphoribosyltransferase